MSEEIVVQDTLKHLAEREYEGRDVSAASLAEELSLSGDEAARILHDLEAAELLEPGVVRLTQSGREYAMHVLRAHRLYETYLARKTGARASQWHVQAHVEEHKLSAAQVEQLSRDLDHPRFDPHGDPIPTAAGVLPPRQGAPLLEHPAGWEGKVTHIEDEPPRLYSAIAAASIAPGTVLRIESKSDRECRVATEGRTFRFPLEVVRQLTVVPLAEGEQYDESVRRLSSLAEDEEATVVRLSPLCRGLERSRLLDLGLVPGTVIHVDLVSPSGSPIAYRVRGASIALRKEQAERVLIRKTKGA